MPTKTSTRTRPRTTSPGATRRFSRSAPPAKPGLLGIVTRTTVKPKAGKSAGTCRA